jgi:TonB family protein
MLVNELFNSNSEPVIEGVLDNPGQEDSPVAQAIIRRILMQRTDLLAKHGPEKVGQAVDEVADFVGDVDEIGSSDVSGWVRHVEQMLGNMQEGSLEEIDRRGFLKGVGAAAVAGTGLSPMPAKAWFFFIIPLPNTNPDAAANACMPPTVQVGQQVNFQNELQVIQKIHGVSNRCQNPNMPVAVTIGKPEPVQAPVVKEPPNQKTPPNYASRIIARIRPNIHYSGDTSGNPRAEIEVRVSSDGTITGVKLEKSSGNSEWDQAVIDAVKKTQTMPLDSTGNVPSIMIMGFRPIDNQSLQRESVDQGMAEGDISQIEKDVAAAPVEPIANMEAQEKIGGRHDADDFDDMVSRLKKLAGSGPMKTVYDPNTRRYKNVPVAQQPGDKK